MQFPVRWRRKMVLLLLGAAFGAGAVWSLRMVSVAAGRHPLHASVSSTTSATAAQPGTTARHAHRKDRLSAAQDWQAVAQAYRKESGDATLADGLLLKLDAAAVGRLAAEIITWPRNGQNVETLNKVFTRWGALDPMTALVAATKVVTPDWWNTPYWERDNPLNHALAGYWEADPAGACAFLARDPDPNNKAELALPDRRRHLYEALYAWAASDPRSAASFIDQMHDDDLSWGIYQNVAWQMAYEDRDAALAWAERQTGRGGLLARSHVAKQWLETDREAALSYAVNAPETGQIKSEMIHDIVEDWAGRAPRAVLDWAAGQNADAQNGAVLAAAPVWAREDPTAMAAWAAEMPPGEMRAYAWWNACAGLAAKDPAAAIQWLNGLPEGKERVDAADHLFLQMEPAAAEQLVSSQPPGFGRDAAASAFATRQAENKDYPGAADWLRRIDDQAYRNAMLTRLVNRWLQNDAPQARQWMAQGNLPPELAEKFSGK